VLAVVALVAAACSSSAPSVGALGSTLPAMGGTITLVKVISPVYVLPDSAGPSFGHKLVAVVLTVHAPTGSAAPFASVYGDSKLIDSSKLVHIGLSTAKFHVSACATLPPFTTVAAGHDQSGCDIFQVSAAAIPTELKITGKAKAEWKILPTQITPGVPPASLLPRKALTAPHPLSSLKPTTPTATSIPGEAAPGAKATTPGATTPSVTTPGGGATATTTPAKGSVAPAHHRGHRLVSVKAPTFGHFSPNGGASGSKVQISGKRLSNVTVITFDGVPAVIRKEAPGRIIAIVPVGARTGPIVLTTPTGTLTSSREFVVL
jgi:hypothetical protein